MTKNKLLADLISVGWAEDCSSLPMKSTGRCPESGGSDVFLVFFFFCPDFPFFWFFISEIRLSFFLVWLLNFFLVQTFLFFVVYFLDFPFLLVVYFLPRLSDFFLAQSFPFFGYLFLRVSPFSGCLFLALTFWLWLLCSQGSWWATVTLFLLFFLLDFSFESKLMSGRLFAAARHVADRKGRLSQSFRSGRAHAALNCWAVAADRRSTGAHALRACGARCTRRTWAASRGAGQVGSPIATS